MTANYLVCNIEVTEKQEKCKIINLKTPFAGLFCIFVTEFYNCI